MRATGMALGVVVALLAASQAQAQKASGTAGASGGSWGPVVGLNMAKFSGSDATSADLTGTHTGFVAGLQGQRAFGGIDLRLGVQYSQRGGEGGGATVKLNYIEVPVTAIYNINMSGSQLRPYVLGGAVLGFKASCDVEISGGGSGTCADAGFDVKGFSWGIDLGAGVNVPMGANHIAVEAGYLIGMSNTATGFNGKSSGLGFRVAYMLPMHH